MSEWLHTVPVDAGGIDLGAERARLVRLCTRLTGDPVAAEDLAQETLVLAWQNGHKLHGPQFRASWLAGIARNLCKHWWRRRRTELRRQMPPGLDATGERSLPEPVSPLDLEADVEQAELARLLDQALGLLPAQTRTALVAHYIERSPHTEIAARLGLTVDAVDARLRRGKEALRRLLRGPFKEEVAAFGWADPGRDQWQETRIWCPECGRQRRLIRFPGAQQTISFACPACSPDMTVPGAEYRLANAHFAQLLTGLSRPRAILNRSAAWVATYYPQVLETGLVPCTHCGRPSCA